MLSGVNNTITYPNENLEWITPEIFKEAAIKLKIFANFFAKIFQKL
jgi:hypothetical protein